MNQRPNAVDLFAGAGGMSLGFEQAGFDVVAAVEIDPIHCAVHHFNFPKCTTICASVSAVSGTDIREKAGIGDSEVDVVFGGSPCQGFSLIGKRAIDDPRNSLVKDFVRIVAELNAKYFVFENVKGLTVGKHRKFLDELAEEFKNHGYNVVLPWKVLNAYDHGVPQSRERLFLMGARDDLKLPSYPEQTTTGAGKDSIEGIPKGPSVWDAIGDLPNADKFKSLIKSDHVKTSWQSHSEYARTMREESNSSSSYSYRREFDRNILTASLRTDHSEVSRKRFDDTAEGNVEPVSRYFKLPKKGVSNTLRAGTDSARGAFTSPRPIHPKHPRCVTVREMARLHSFPDWFRFHVTKWHGARQIGNAVPPLLAKAVASRIMQALGKEPTVPDAKLKLGKTALLSMDMTRAAEFWSVPVPIAQRIRKGSGKVKSPEQGAQSDTPRHSL